MDVGAVQRFADADPSALLPQRPGFLTQVDGPPMVRDLLDLGGGRGVAIAAVEAGLVVVPVVEETGVVRRAVAGEGVWSAILAVMADGGSRGGFHARRWNDIDVCDLGREVAIAADHSNDVVVVGQLAVVKLYPRTAPGPQPGLDVPAHLAAVGFAAMPTPVGALTWGEGDGAALVGTAAAYLPGARDGWGWFVDAVQGALDAARAWPTDEVASLAAITGRFHRAMATPSDVLPDPVGTGPADPWLKGAEATLATALAVTDGPEGERLREAEDVVRSAFGIFGEVDATPLIRTHGDLHIGQVLRWDGGDALIDFDGNPLAPVTERIAPSPAARDVASMLRAIDHAARICQRRSPGNDGRIRAWLREVRPVFLDTYRAALGAEHAHVFDERLLGSFEVVQECHEFVYAARYVPRWRYVPDLALPDLLESLP